MLSVKVINPKTIKSFYDIPNSPKKEDIEKITNINILKQKEKQYDDFLEKNWQLLLLLDQAESKGEEVRGKMLAPDRFNPCGPASMKRSPLCALKFQSATVLLSRLKPSSDRSVALSLMT